MFVKCVGTESSRSHRRFQGLCSSADYSKLTVNLGRFKRSIKKMALKDVILCVGGKQDILVQVPPTFEALHQRAQEYSGETDIELRYYNQELTSDEHVQKLDDRACVSVLTMCGEPCQLVRLCIEFVPRVS